MSAPSILFINRVYYPDRGATGRILRDAAEAFAQAGWQVSVLTTGHSTKVESCNGVNVTRIKVPSRRHAAWFYLFVWCRLLVKSLFFARHDIVVSMTDPPLVILIGRLYARLKKAKHIHWCQDLYPDLFPALNVRLPGWLMRYMRRLSRRSMKRADRVIVIGRCMARYLVQTGMSASDLTLITNWPDKEILADGKPAERLYESQGILQDNRPRFRILYAGAIGHAHPVKTIMDAVIALNDTHPDIEFVFIGDDAGHERLARQRDRAGLTNIRMMPFQPVSHIRTIMESADAHLVSQYEAASGLVVPSKFYSAIASGRPCLYIGPHDSEITQVIDHFHCGLNIPNGDSQTLIRAILALRDNADIWQEAHDGAMRARAVFTPEQSVQAFIKRAVQLRQAG